MFQIYLTLQDRTIMIVNLALSYLWYNASSCSIYVKTEYGPFSK